MVLLGRRDGQTWSFATSRGAYDNVTAARVQRQYWPENLPKPGDMDISSSLSTPTQSHSHTPPAASRSHSQSALASSCSRSPSTSMSSRSDSQSTMLSRAHNQSTSASSCSWSPPTSTSSRSYRPLMSSRYRPYTPISSRSHSQVEDVFSPRTIDGAPGGASISRAPHLLMSSSEPSAITDRACGRNEELEDMARLLEALAGH